MELVFDIYKKYFMQHFKIFVELTRLDIIFNSLKISLIEPIFGLGGASFPVIFELQNNVWGYSSDLETHTVETHIYRLRKKMKDKFGDDVFIQNSQKGYKIN